MTDNDKEKLFSRRAIILGGMQAALLSTLLGRMFYLEILSNKHYKKLSDNNRINSRLTMPLRGIIYDRNGRMLATNHNIYRALMIRDEADDWRACLQKTQKFLDLTDEEVDAVAKEIKRKPKFMPVAIKDNLSWKEVTTLELHLPDIAGVYIEEGRNRHYLYPLETCHLLGYVATPSEKDLDGDPLLELPGMKIGKGGIEKFHDLTLRGSPGVSQVEMNAHRQIVRELSTTDSVPGDNLNLHLDLDLQQTLYQRLIEHESAGAVVLDIQTGGVLSYLSTPGFDSNLFVNGIPKKEWSVLSNHPHHTLVNKPIAGLYAPGSTFKMTVALAALEKGLIDHHTSVHCGGHVSLGNHRFHCWRWKEGGHGSVDLERAIASSCDIFFYHVGSLLGIDAISEMGMRLGMGGLTGIEIPGEKPGLMPTKSWKSSAMGQPWTAGETYNASIGQGYLLVTPMQLAVMIARIASGKAVSPKLCKGDPVDFPSLGLNPKFHQYILNGLNKASNEPGGTSYANRISEPGFEMAGKTGTTQVRRITQRDRELGFANTAKLPWQFREHAVFVGYAPVHAPRFAAAILVEHGGGGGRVAAPIGRDALLVAQQIIGNKTEE